MLRIVLLEILADFQQWKNYENQLIFDEIIVTIGWRVFWDTV